MIGQPWFGQRGYCRIAGSVACGFERTCTTSGCVDSRGNRLVWARWTATACVFTLAERSRDLPLKIVCFSNSKFRSRCGVMHSLFYGGPQRGNAPDVASATTLILKSATIGVHYPSCPQVKSDKVVFNSRAQLVGVNDREQAGSDKLLNKDPRFLPLRVGFKGIQLIQADV